MASYKGHIAGGVVFSGVFVAALSFLPIVHFAEKAQLLSSWQAIAAIFVIGMLFGLFPDVDTNSKAQDIFFSFAFTIDVLLLASNSLQAAAYLGLIAMLPIIGHHRGWTHAKWAMLVVPLPILLLPYLYNQQNLPIAAIYYGAAVTGYFSHLLLDNLIFKHIGHRH
jgi:membrane-bound metal-dependent hydrolase YbcI (DUF457 family)